MTDPTITELVERVAGNWLNPDGAAALTTLASRCEELTEDRDFWKYEQTDASKDLVARAERAEARVDELDLNFHKMLAQAMKEQAKAQRLREVLEEIANDFVQKDHIVPFARAALSKEPRT